MIDSKIDLESLALVSGIGCTGRVAGYVKLDSFHTTHGRAIPFATGLKLANPKLNVVVYSGDGDLSAIGGNHLIHAARRNIDLKVICVNNLIYAMTGGQTAPTTPGHATTSTNPYGTFEPAFNLPHLVEAAGAVYVARWTTFHVRQLARSISEAFQQKGILLHRSHLALSHALSAPQQNGRRSRHHEVLQRKEQSEDMARPPAKWATLNGEIAVGKFVDRDRPDYQIHDARAVRRVAGRSLHRRARNGVRMRLTEIRIAGFGGQGVILSAIVLGKAARFTRMASPR